MISRKTTNKEKFEKSGSNYLGHDTICICGLYKCGTSWLSLAFGFHPEVKAFSEFDIIKIFAKEQSVDLKRTSKSERVKYLFGASNYGQLNGEGIKISNEIQSDELFLWLSKNAPQNRDKSLPLQTFWDLDEQTARSVCDLICSDNPPEKLIRQFAFLHNFFMAKKIVFKSADQVNHFCHIEHILPQAKKIVIVRDGRDMAISAVKFESYIRRKTELAKIWAMEEFNFWDRLSHWTQAAFKIHKAASAGQILLVRYEDLCFEFNANIQNLFLKCGLSVNDEILKTIQEASSFARLTGGRERGKEDLNSSFRRGMVGEWREVLEPGEKAKAWEIAGKALELFGYTKE